MVHLLRTFCITWGVLFFLQMISPLDLWAFSIVKRKDFKEGPLTFKLEVQIYGSGRLKSQPIRVSSLKVKIKNEKASSEMLKVKTIRVFPEPLVYKDIETRGYSISPAQWVTKYYRLRKERQPLLGDQGYLEIAFDNFTIRFHPRKRNFEGPLQ